MRNEPQCAVAVLGWWGRTRSENQRVISEGGDELVRVRARARRPPCRAVMRHAVVLCFRSPPFEPYLSSSGLEARVLSLQLAELLLDATQHLDVCLHRRDRLFEAPLGLLSCFITMAVDLRERGEIWVGQLCVITHLTHAWPRASSAAGEARRDHGRDQRGAGEGGRAWVLRTSSLPVMVVSAGRFRVASSAFRRTWRTRGDAPARQLVRLGAMRAVGGAMSRARARAGEGERTLRSPPMVVSAGSCTTVSFGFSTAWCTRGHQQGRLGAMHATAVAISRVRARTRAHLEILTDVRERASIQRGQLVVHCNLAHT